MNTRNDRNQPQQTLHLLIADDNEDDIMLIRRAFQAADVPVEISVVSDGADAVRFLNQETPFENEVRPQLVLLDINMPRKDGFQALAEIKANSSLKAIPVVMMTTSHREEDITLSYASGASSFITKPSTIQELESVAKHLWTYWTSVASLPPAG